MEQVDSANSIYFRTMNTKYYLRREDNESNTWIVDRVKDGKTVAVYENMKILKLDLFSVAFMSSDSDDVMTTVVQEIEYNLQKQD